jgi:hypothetical protein
MRSSGKNLSKIGMGLILVHFRKKSPIFCNSVLCCPAKAN